MKHGTTVKELIDMLKEYPMDNEVRITTIVDTKKLTDDDLCGDIEGIYYVEAEVLGVDEMYEENEPMILAEDINYDGYCDKEIKEQCAAK